MGRFQVSFEPEENVMVTDPRCSRIERRLLQRIGNSVPIRFLLGNGERVSRSESEPIASVFVPDWQTLAGVVLNPEIGIGDGYADGRILVERALDRLLENIFRSTPTAKTEGFCSNLMSRWLQRTQANTLRGSARNT